MPRKREYRLYSIKQTTVTVPASLLKVEHEYFHTVKDQEKIITDQVQDCIKKNGDQLLEWISIMNLEKEGTYRRMKLSNLKKINCLIEIVCYSLQHIGFFIMQGKLVLMMIDNVEYSKDMNRLGIDQRSYELCEDEEI